LFNWVEAIERALPWSAASFGSEGEENFEARWDAIVAQRVRIPVWTSPGWQSPSTEGSQQLELL